MRVVAGGVGVGGEGSLEGCLVQFGFFSHYAVNRCLASPLFVCARFMAKLCCLLKKRYLTIPNHLSAQHLAPHI